MGTQGGHLAVYEEPSSLSLVELSTGYVETVRVIVTPALEKKMFFGCSSTYYSPTLPSRESLGQAARHRPLLPPLLPSSLHSMVNSKTPPCLEFR